LGSPFERARSGVVKNSHPAAISSTLPRPEPPDGRSVHESGELLMFFVALATDYDGTIATDGQTPADVIAALSRLKASGRRLILVTGRELPDLKIAFPEHEIFDRIVAENGALLYEPATQRQRALADAPSEAFVGALKKAGVSPLSVGKVIVATWEPNETLVLE